MSYTRRDFIVKSGIALGAAAVNLPSNSSLHDMNGTEGDRLVLLGTQGGPLIRSYKQSPSASLIVNNNIPYVIDTGYGVTFKLIEAGISLSSLQYIFITHHHSDHNLELGPLLYNCWVGGLSKPIHVYAPAGLNDLLNYYWQSNRFDIETRIADEGRPDIRKLVVPHEFTEGTILNEQDMTVMSMRNIHPPVTESYAFKFKTNKKTIVFSGDTTYCPALVTFAAGADYLVHEVMNIPGVEALAKRRPNAPKLKASILSHHTSAEDVGRIATAANVGTLVLNHFVPPDDKSLTDQVWIDAVRTTFSGKVVVGKDLMEFPF
jgi:ribonuclease BN (tRNA processing enzyme)